MAKPKWTAFPHPAKEFAYPGEALKKNWQRLHRGDCEPFPGDPDVQEAWRLFHQGKFGEAVALGRGAGAAGTTVANKAQAIYANGVETRDAARISHFQEVMKHAEAHTRAEPRNANAHYLFAYAAGRYSQSISVAKALSEGYGGKIRTALETALKLQPAHAEAHVAMGAFHAEVIDKIGALVGGITYGAKREAGEEHYRKALKLTPDSPIAHIEMARGLLLMHGKRMRAEADKLFARAASIKPRDAMEALDVEAARREVE